jgi:hypothetical protein
VEPEAGDLAAVIDVIGSEEHPAAVPRKERVGGASQLGVASVCQYAAQIIDAGRGADLSQRREGLGPSAKIGTGIVGDPPEAIGRGGRREIAECPNRCLGARRATGTTALEAAIFTSTPATSDPNRRSRLMTCRSPQPLCRISSAARQRPHSLL